MFSEPVMWVCSQKPGTNGVATGMVKALDVYETLDGNGLLSVQVVLQQIFLSG